MMMAAGVTNDAAAITQPNPPKRHPRNATICTTVEPGSGLVSASASETSRSAHHRPSFDEVRTQQRDRCSESAERDRTE